MPRTPKRPCRYPGCPNLCEKGIYCEEHSDYSADRLRGGAAARGYDARWQKARKAFLTRRPLCAECLKNGTPGECCRLQGYPDGWCENLESPAPSNKETDRWEAIFEEWRTAMGGKIKPKTRRQIIRWLQSPHTDSAEYKAYGNSVAVPCVFFVLAGIVWAMEEGEQNEND